MPETLDQKEMLAQLRKYVAEFPTHTQAAKELNITRSHLSDMLHGKRNISTTIAGKLGFTKKTVYEGA